MSSQTVTESTTATDPPLSTTSYSVSSSKRFTGGPTVHFAVNGRFGINLDFLYKRAGYDAGTVVSTQPTDDTESEVLSQTLERTRADYWDIPIQGRFYFKTPEDGGARPFVTGGAVFRTVSAVRSFSETINAEGLSDTTTTPVQPAHKNVRGAVAGVGWQFRDEVGLKIELEARFTRWFQRPFESGRTLSDLNEGSVFFGITF